MPTLRQVRRRNTWIALSASLFVSALIPVGAVVAWRAVRDSNAAEEVVALPTRSVPSTPTAVIGVTDEQNFLTSLAVVALTPGGAGGTVMLVPVGSLLGGQPIDQPRRIADVYGSDGVDALKKAVEDMTNSQIDLIAVNGVTGTGELIARAGTVSAEFATDVNDSEVDAAGNDETVVLRAAGPHDMTPIEAAEVLAARDQAANEDTRFAPVRAVWDGIASATGNGRPGAVPAPVIPDLGAQVPADMTAFMSAFFAGPVSVWQFGAQRIEDPARNPEGIDVYGYNVGEVVMVMASVAPSAMVPVFPTLSVQIDSPYPDVEVAEQGVFRLLYMGVNVLLARSTSATPPKVTTIRYTEEVDRAMTEPLTTMFGEIVYEKATERVDRIDVQVILGDSFVEFLRNGAQPDPNVDVQAGGSDAVTTDTVTPAESTTVP